MTRRVLIITYYFPPRPGVASIRLRGLAKFLPEFGWDPVILTARLPQPHSPQFRVIETPYPGNATHLLKRKLGLSPERGLQEQLGVPLAVREKKNSFTRTLVLAAQEIIAYPDDHKLWRPYAVSEGLRLLQEERFDVLLSSFGPATVHLVAKDLKAKTALPWVADFRDLWTQNHYYPYNNLRKWFEKRLEAKTVARADALVTVSQPLTKKLSAAVPDIPAFTITNGFDPDELNNGFPLTDKFTITYTGQLYGGKQDPTPLFQAIKELVVEKKIDQSDVFIRFYGPRTFWLEQEAKKYGLGKNMEQYGKIPREEAIDRQRESQILLLLDWNSPDEVGIYTGKLFEYLAAERPILAIGGSKGVVSELLAETGAGIHCSNFEMLKKQIYIWYQKYKATQQLPFERDTNKILQYSHRSMAKKFAGVLTKAMANSLTTPLEQQ